MHTAGHASGSGALSGAARAGEEGDDRDGQQRRGRGRANEELEKHGGVRRERGGRLARAVRGGGNPRLTHVYNVTEAVILRGSRNVTSTPGGREGRAGASSV